MRKELIFNDEHSNYRIGKYHMQKDKKTININIKVNI